MAQVQKVELDIQYPFSGQGTAQVTVRSWLSFAPEDNGKDFKLSIALYGSDVGEARNRDPMVTIYGPRPLYIFRFGVRDYTQIRGTVGVVVHEEKREVAMAALDEDPGYVFTPLPTPPWTPQAYARTPYADEIYAVATLSSDGRSDVLKMKYIFMIVQ